MSQRSHTLEPIVVTAVDASLGDVRRVQRIQTITIAWMTLESVLSLAAAWRARSPALLAFGGDSAIELLSATTVLWRFRSRAEYAEKWAARIAGSLLFVLAGFVVITSGITLLGYAEPHPSYVGMVVLGAAAVFMPWLAREKRLLSASTGSAALRSDAAESALCGYLSLIALLGLIVNSAGHIRWADPIAALAIVPFIVREAWEAVRGKPCGCLP